VEKVVSEPRKPVITNNRHSGANAGKSVKKLINTPAKYPPIRFVANVPSGIGGKIELSAKPSNQRDVAPVAAPMQIAKTELNMNLLQNHQNAHHLQPMEQYNEKLSSMTSFDFEKLNNAVCNG